MKHKKNISSNLISIHKAHMQNAFKNANKGTNKVYPNPFVGAVIVKAGKIMGEGYHEECGKAHAEVNAIRMAQTHAKGADLYVTLEPCSTYGRTPPCTTAIAEAGIKRVFFGAYDSNKKNRKKAEMALKTKNIETVFIDFQKTNDELNRVFLHNLTSKIPYVILKAAISLDGKIMDSKGKSKWITGAQSRTAAHQIRQLSDGIIIGANTFNKDNPKLTVRLAGNQKFKDPAKIIISASGNLKTNNELLSKNTKGEVIIFTSEPASAKLRKNIKNNNCIVVSMGKALKQISLKGCLTYLKKRGYHNLLVEGGAKLLGQFIKLKLFNELHLYVAPKFFGGNKGSFCGDKTLFTVNNKTFLKLDKIKQINNDLYLEYRNVYRNNKSLK